MVKRDCRLGERCGPVEPRDRRRALRPRAAEALPDPLPVRAYVEIYKTISLNFQIWEEVQRQNYSGSFSRLITTSASISAAVVLIGIGVSVAAVMKTRKSTNRDSHKISK